MTRYVCDWMLVLLAYFCGKVLRIKKYRPISNQYVGGMDLVRFSFPLTASRMTKLMRLWGYRMATLEELKQLVNQPEEPKPNPDWLKDDDWDWNRNNRYGFLSVRK